MMNTPKRSLKLQVLLLLVSTLSALTIISCSDDDLTNDIEMDIVQEDEIGDENSESDEESNDDGDSSSSDEGNDENTDEGDSTEEGEGTGDEGSESGNDGETGNDGTGDEGSDEESQACTNPIDFIFLESNGLVTVEFENGNFSGDWELQTNEPDYSGEGYMVWTGSQSFNTPGNGLTIFKIEINNPGTYQFLWNSAVTIGSDGTEHNDTWLRFADADDYFGQKSGSIVYPKGTGKTPNPNGSSADGWFKIYRSGSDLGFKWQSKTSDHDGHNIFVTFDSPGVYTMEVSARSSGHAIDKFVLFSDSYSSADATDAVNGLSEIDCN